MGTKLVERGITRYDIESQGTYGYMVRISRDGVHFNEFFSDKNYKGKRKALAAARARYQELKDSLPEPQTTRNVITSRNSSGVVGVHRASSESIYGETYSSYCASWKSDEGDRNKISFSVKKYGEKQAWELACLARKHMSTDREKIEAMLAKAESKSKKKKSKKKTSKKTKTSASAKKSKKSPAKNTKRASKKR